MELLSERKEEVWVVGGVGDRSGVRVNEDVDVRVGLRDPKCRGNRPRLPKTLFLRR